MFCRRLLRTLPAITTFCLTFLDVGEDLVPESADEAEETRQGEPASHRKRKRRQRDLAEHEREFARSVVARSNGPAAAGRRQSLADRAGVTDPHVSYFLASEIKLALLDISGAVKYQCNNATTAARNCIRGGPRNSCLGGPIIQRVCVAAGPPTTLTKSLDLHNYHK